MFFKGLSVARIVLRPEAAPLTILAIKKMTFACVISKKNLKAAIL